MAKANRHRIPPTYDMDLYRGDTMPPIVFIVPYVATSVKAKLVGVKDPTFEICTLDSLTSPTAGIVIEPNLPDIGKTRLTWRNLTLAEHDKIFIQGGASYDLQVTVDSQNIRTVVRGTITSTRDIS